MKTRTPVSTHLLSWISSLAWITLIVLGLLTLAGGSYSEALKGFFNGAFGGRNMAYLLTTISRAALIIGMALAVMTSFRAGLYNIGVEGQLVLGGLAAAVVAVYVPGSPLLVIALSMVTAMLAGACWALVAGVLQVSLGVPLLVGSLLLNYPARYIASYLVGHPLRDVQSGLTQTHLIAAERWLPLFPGTRLDIGVLFIILATIFAIAYSHTTVHGYHARMTGLAPTFARASGLPIKRLTLQTLAMSGALAGLVGAIAVLGIHHRFADGMLLQPLYAWTGLVAVLLVGMVPWAVPLSGFFFAFLQTGAAGIERTAGVPREIALIIQAVIILLIASRIASADFNRDRNNGSDDGH